LVGLAILSAFYAERDLQSLFVRLAVASNYSTGHVLDSVLDSVALSSLLAYYYSFIMLSDFRN